MDPEKFDVWEAKDAQSTVTVDPYGGIQINTTFAEEWAVGVGGWLRFKSRDLPYLAVFLRFEEDSGNRLFITDVHLEPVGPLRATQVRSIPFRRIESIANSPMFDNHIRSTIRDGGSEDPRALLARWEPLGYEATRSTEEDLDLTLDIPGRGRRYPDKFFEEFSAAWTSASKVSNTPSKLVAEANDVARKTVLGWLRQARQRGLIAPGRSPIQAEDE